jgi:hypothetical protein
MEDEEEDEASLRDVEPEGIVTVQRQCRFIRDSRRANNELFALCVLFCGKQFALLLLYYGAQ